jgi:hypothetical protein
MPKPLQIPAVVAPVANVSTPKRITPSNAAAFLIPLNIRKGDQAGRHQLKIEHKPGKPSIILLKILAMETHPANAERVDRRRQFCKNFIAPVKTPSPR